MIRDLVHKKILELSRGKDRPRIGLCKDDWELFIKETLSIYQMQYGGLVASADEPDRESVLFMGCPIVLDFNATPLEEAEG